MAFDTKGLEDYIDVPQRIADFREQHPGGGLEPADPAMPYHVVRVPNGWCRQCIGRRTVKSGRDTWKQCPRCEGSGVRPPEEPQEDVYIVYAAAARRAADDAHPGVGMAWEPYPGQTPYTSGSELMNAETSAWGRAIVASLSSDSKRGVSSREEVRNRRAERDDEPPARRAERGPLPAEQDHWTDQPAGQLNGEPYEPEKRTDEIDGNQRSKIFGQFKRLHITDPAEQRQTLSRILGRDVPSRKGLSYVDAEKVVKALKERKPEPQPEAATP